MNKIQISFKSALKKARDRGFTQDEIGKELGVSQMTISRWERGEVPRRPNADMFASLKALHTKSPYQL